MSTNEPTLGLCPFCGGNGKWSPKHYATVITCDACGADGPPCEDIEEAAGAWNRRQLSASGHPVESQRGEDQLAVAIKLLRQYYEIRDRQPSSLVADTYQFLSGVKS